MNWPFRRESVTFAWSKIPPLHSTFFHSSQTRGIWSPSMNGRLTSPFLTHWSNINSNWNFYNFKISDLTQHCTTQRAHFSCNILFLKKFTYLSSIHVIFASWTSVRHSTWASCQSVNPFFHSSLRSWILIQTSCCEWTMGINAAMNMVM